ncbi:P-loop containing nucleoside triphosphate hydrolase protein [Crucibulum laeve]|uniref:Gluconokinase n=1 Tax=Crucibulum laeve TaxID=68775 RepID=A0A5C3MFI4_9AGAR|nr:P-loop containing nucleoside triphosphate hydrolase protein [Crucibulum laeve]
MSPTPPPSLPAQNVELQTVSRLNPGCMFIVVMGVSGTGKSTLGNALAKELNMPYVEGDDLHPRANVEKMSAGIPLTDEDREPWLELIRTTAEHYAVEQQVEKEGNETDTQDENAKKVGGKGVVISCSALKKYYRDILRGRRKPASLEKSPEEQTVPSHLEPSHPDILPTYFVFINGPRKILLDRMQKRPGHFMKASMLDSQLRTLESPEDEEGVVVVELTQTTEEQVRVAKEGLSKLSGVDFRS